MIFACVKAASVCALGAGRVRKFKHEEKVEGFKRKSGRKM